MGRFDLDDTECVALEVPLLKALRRSVELQCLIAACRFTAAFIYGWPVASLTVRN